MANKFDSNHFYDKFDRYTSWEERFKAAARQAAMLLNNLEDQKESEFIALVRIRDALATGINPVKLALSIQTTLQEKYDTTADVPTINNLEL